MEGRNDERKKERQNGRKERRKEGSNNEMKEGVITLNSVPECMHQVIAIENIPSSISELYIYIYIYIY